MADEPLLAVKLGPCSCFCLNSAAGYVAPSSIIESQTISYGYGGHPQARVRDTRGELQVLQPESDEDGKASFLPRDLPDFIDVLNSRRNREESQDSVPVQPRRSNPPTEGDTRVSLQSSPPPSPPAAASSASPEQRRSLPQPRQRRRDSVSEWRQVGEDLTFINDTLKMIWPLVGPAVQHELKCTVLPQIREQSPALLRGTIEAIRFSRFDLGERPPELHNIRVFDTQGPAGTGMEICIEIDFDADIDIEISLNNMLRLGVNKLRIAGDVAVRLEPLINEVPVVGGAVLFFYDPPKIDIGFTGLASFLKSPEIISVIRSILDKQISNLLVMPNVLAFRIGREDQGVDLAHLQRPAPLGILRVTALRATNLTAADWNFIGAGTSDPYLRVQLSDQWWKSPVVKKTCNPVWSHGEISHDFFVYSQEQKLQIDVFDEDLGSNLGLNKDDHIGRAHSMPIHYAIAQSEQPIALFDPVNKDKEAGKLFLRLDWFEAGKKLKSPAEVMKDKGPDKFIVEVKVDEVYMAPHFGKSVGLRAAFVGKESQTRQTQIQDKVVTTALHNMRVKMAKTCYSMGKSLDETSYVTKVPMPLLEEVLGLTPVTTNGGSSPRNASGLKQFFKDRFGGSAKQTLRSNPKSAVAKTRLELESVLRFVATREQLQYEAIELTLFNDKGSHGKAEVHSDKYDGVERVLDFGSNDLQAEISVSIQSLHPSKRLDRRETHMKHTLGHKHVDVIKSLQKSMRKTETSRKKLLKEKGNYCEWLNEMLDTVWPHVDKAVDKIVKSEVQANINKELPNMNVKFKKVSLGTVAPTLGPITVSSDEHMVEIMIDVHFNSEIEVAVSTRVVSVGIKSLKFNGRLCCRLMHLIPQLPIVGGITVFFLDAPMIDYTFTESIKAANFLKSTIRNGLEAVLSEQMVLPNVLSIPLGTEAQGVDRASLNRPPPISVLKVTAIRAQKLVAADMNLFSQDTSDPYLKVSMSDQTWNSPVVKATLNPEWKEGVRSKYFLVYNKEQRLRIDVYDYDNFSKHDLIGSIEPLTVDEAVDVSEEEIEVLEPYTKKPTAGKLWMRFESIPIGTAIGTVGAPFGHHVMLEVKVDEVFWPAIYGHSCKMAAKFGTETRSTKMKSVDEPNINVALRAVERELEAVVKRCHEREFSTDNIEHVTELNPQEITKMLKTRHTKLDKGERRDAIEHTTYMIDLEYMLHFVVPTTQVSHPKAELKLAMLDHKSKEVGKAVVSLNNISSESREVFFTSPGGKEIKAEITVAVVGLIQDGPDDKTDVPEPVTRSRKVLSCLSGPCSRICS